MIYMFKEGCKLCSLCMAFHWPVGGQFGQNDQKLHENYKISVFGSEQWGDMGGQSNFSCSGGGISPVPPTTRGDPAR